MLKYILKWVTKAVNLLIPRGLIPKIVVPLLFSSLCLDCFLQIALACELQTILHDHLDFSVQSFFLQLIPANGTFKFYFLLFCIPGYLAIKRICPFQLAPLLEFNNAISAQNGLTIAALNCFKLGDAGAEPALDCFVDLMQALSSLIDGQILLHQFNLSLHPLHMIFNTLLYQCKFVLLVFLLLPVPPLIL